MVMPSLRTGVLQIRKASEQGLTSSEEVTWGRKGCNEEDEYIGCRMNLSES